MSNYPALFTPGRIGRLELRNRLVLAPMGSNFADYDHHVTDQLIAYHVARARGGMGLNVVEHTAVHPLGLTGARMLAIYDDDMIPGLARLAQAVHEAGGRIAVQLQHGGRQANEQVIGRKPLSPSAVPSGRDRRVPEKMTVDDIREAIAAFAAGARRAQQAGMDGVEVHMAHGYLGCSFLSPLLNRRDDEYGGDTERRVRFAREVRAAIAERCGPEFPCWCRISADEFIEGGTDLQEALRFAPLLEQAGYQAIHVSVCIGETACWASAPYYVPQGHLLEYAAAIKRVVTVPVIAVGRIVEPAMADQAIRDGRCDFVAIGRSSLADPEWPNKAQSGREEEIIRCFACNLGCSDRRYSEDGEVGCTANPWTGREHQWPDYPRGPRPRSRRRVLIIGAGPAGMQAAIVAAHRGHDVTVWERQAQVGGQWRLAAVPPGKAELASMTRWQLEEMRGTSVTLELEREATVDEVLNFDPDVVVIATGARPLRGESLPLGAGGRYELAWDVLAGTVALADPVYIVGGDQTGAETAHLLAEQGHQVTILERSTGIGLDIPAAPRQFLLTRLEELGVRLLVGHEVLGLDAEGINCQTAGGTRRFNAPGSVVLAIGRRPEDGLARKLEQTLIEAHVIGDARQPRHAQAAVHEGAAIGREI